MIKNRYDFVLLFDVKDGNPNGDPDAGNFPRIDPETRHGLVTDVCLKRKVRNYVGITKDQAEGFEIYVKERAILTAQQERAYTALGLGLNTPEEGGDSHSLPATEEAAKKKPGRKVRQASDIDIVESARDWMCRTFFDIRAFGAVMSLKENPCGQVRGPIQLTFARSIDPILPTEHSITRMAVATVAEAEKQGGENRTMGRKSTVPYGLYRVSGFVSPMLAEKTHFTGEDLALLWKALLEMFEYDRSAARGLMATQKLYVFEHESMLGNARANQLFDLIRITKTDEGPARSFEDYTVQCDEPPTGVKLLDMTQQ